MKEPAVIPELMDWDRCDPVTKMFRRIFRETEEKVMREMLDLYDWPKESK